jgi:hypothetical protein
LGSKVCLTLEVGRKDRVVAGSKFGVLVSEDGFLHLTTVCLMTRKLWLVPFMFEHVTAAYKSAFFYRALVHIMAKSGAPRAG